MAEEPVYELRSRRIRIHPTKDQRTKLDQWFGAVRYCYNQLVGRFKLVGKGGVNRAALRQVVKEKEVSEPWLNDIPRAIKDVAVRDFEKARVAHFAKLKTMKTTATTTARPATFKFRSRRDKQQSFEVNWRDMETKSGYYVFIHLENINAREKLPAKVEHAVRFVKDRLNRYFIVVPTKVYRRPVREGRRKRTIALDPGVRTFQTMYDDAGNGVEWGKGDMKQLFRLCRLMDRLQSKMSKAEVRSKKRKSMRRAWIRIQERIQNLVKDAQCKLAKWLCEEYTVILVPKFETSRMIRKLERKIHAKTARNMVTWRHYQFREMLKAKAKLYSDVKVVECSEAYTSKTCGRCGTIHAKLGGSKTFNCPSCGLEADRDLHAARNILLRYLSFNC